MDGQARLSTRNEIWRRSTAAIAIVLQNNESKNLYFVQNSIFLGLDYHLRLDTYLLDSKRNKINVT